MTTLEYVQRVREFREDLYHDGDSFYLVTSVPFHLTALINVRLLGFDCPELRKGTAFEKARAVLAQTLTAQWLRNRLDPEVIDAKVWVRTEPIEDDFGRWLGDVWAEYPDGTSSRLGDVLRAAGLASVWPTRWREELDPAVTG